jgi:ribokinase
MAKLASILRKCYVFMPSENELKLLTSSPFRKGAATILKHGVSIVAVKLGRKGCYVTNGKENYLIEPPDAKPVDKTGAGDAFSAGFLYGLVRGKDLCECGRLGNFVASRCIEKIGARTGLPKASDLKDI